VSDPFAHMHACVWAYAHAPCPHPCHPSNMHTVALLVRRLIALCRSHCLSSSLSLDLTSRSSLSPFLPLHSVSHSILCSHFILPIISICLSLHSVYHFVSLCLSACLLSFTHTHTLFARSLSLNDKTLSSNLTHPVQTLI
jgi:hypothetical protein